MDVLSTIDFDKYKFGILTVENNEEGSVMSDFMASKGYKVLEESGCDIYFIPN